MTKLEVLALLSDVLKETAEYARRRAGPRELTPDDLEWMARRLDEEWGREIVGAGELPRPR